MIIYAPNINVGGGFVLLQSLILAIPNNCSTILFLDSRIKEIIELKNDNFSIYWVKRSFGSRMLAEKKLQKISSHQSQIFCFNGVPPVFKCKGTISVYLQNRLLLDGTSKIQFGLLVKLRILYEKLVFYKGRNRVHRFFTQTASMAVELENWLRRTNVEEPSSKISISPFFDFNKGGELAIPSDGPKKRCQYDFCYVADGQPHKNHYRLLDALIILAKQEKYPSVALTLGAVDEVLIEFIELKKKQYSLSVYNLGVLRHHKVVELYQQSKALIYPSLVESFGLPLIEASRLGLPIVAAELNYTRDVCIPTETFDPCSPQSIARAMCRFQNTPEKPAKILTSRQFLALLSQDLVGL